MSKFMPIKITWQGITPMLIAVIQDGTPEAKAEAKAELLRMAEIADKAQADAE